MFKRRKENRTKRRAQNNALTKLKRKPQNAEVKEVWEGFGDLKLLKSINIINFY